MNERLQQFLSAENMTQSQLADRLGVAKASISHIIAGRNKPGFDFIESLAHQFPELNLDWLIMGTGNMYKSGSLFDSPDIPQAVLTPDREETKTQTIEIKTDTTNKPTDTSSRNVTKIIVFYNDNTFQELQ